MKEGNFAFIDSQNIHTAVQKQGWHIDWIRFRQYLQDKYHVSKAYIFLGYDTRFQSLYQFLSKAGFEMVYKPTVRLPSGEIKGNIDAELVLQTMIERDNFNKAVIVTNDGDFYCLVKYLCEKNKLETLLASDEKTCSTLFKEFRQQVHFFDKLRSKLAYQKSP